MDPFSHEFDAAYKAAMAEQKAITNLEEALSKAIRQIINEQFPDQIMHLSAEAYRELENVVVKNASKAALDICYAMNDEGLE